MNCIIVCDNANHTGGISSVLIAQAEGLRAIGYKIFVFAAYGPMTPLLEKFTNDYACIHPHESKRNRFSEIWNTNASQQLNEYLKKFNSTDTIIHIHSLSMGLSPAITTALSKHKIPYVITTHDAGWVCPTGYFFDFKKKRYCTYKPYSPSCLLCNCDKKTYLHKTYKLMKIGVLDYVSRLKQDAFSIISPSTLLTDRLVERAPKSTPIITLMNPINTKQNIPHEQKRKSFVFVGRVWEAKGINVLLAAIGDIFPLTIVGDGPTRTNLEDKYPDVKFTGWLSPDEVMCEIRESIALILPSLAIEAFGLVVAEALSQGVPVIVSDRAGAATMIENGYNGFVVNMANPSEISEACAALSNSTVAKRMSLNAYARYWSAPLSTQRYAAGLHEIFSQAMSQTSPTHSLPLAGFPIQSMDALTLSTLLQKRIAAARKTVLLFANTNFVLQCMPLLPWLNSQQVVLVNDGVGLDIAAWLKHGQRYQANLNGTDFTPYLLKGLVVPRKVFLLGGRPGVAEKAATIITNSFGQLVVGCQDGYTAMTPEALRDRINQSGADIVLVAMGNPLQEHWIRDNMAELNATLFMGVGALFDFLSGGVRRAPQWVQRMRCEWLYRLSHEPTRLVKRYTVDIVKFLWVCIWHRSIVTDKRDF